MNRRPLGFPFRPDPSPLPARRLLRAAALALPLSLAGLQAGAQPQSPIYESRDKAGPVFSDQASPGATRIELPPPNVIQTPPVPVDNTPPPPAAPPYQSLAILSPANQGTFHTNTGAIDIRVRLVPGLRSGDRLKVKLDGTVVAHDFRGTTLHLTAADWGAAAQPGSVSHQLAVAVVDASDRVLIESQPVQFYAHHASRIHAR